MRASAIVAVVWSALVLWTCAETLVNLRGSPDQAGASVLGVLILGGVWVAGLGAIALLRYLFAPKRE